MTSRDFLSGRWIIDLFKKGWKGGEKISRC